MNISRVAKAVFAGLLSGVCLGLFLNIVERTTHLNVYTLLLNLDYVPVLNQFYFPETIQFIIHLVISIFIAIGFSFFLNQETYSPLTSIVLVTIVSTIIGFLLFPTTALSNKTPAITSFPALSYWLLGHCLYGILLGFALRK